MKNTRGVSDSGPGYGCWVRLKGAVMTAANPKLACDSSVLRVLSYPRSLIAVLLCLLWTAFWSSAVVVLSHLPWDFSKVVRGILHRWASGMLNILGIDLQVVGANNIPNEGVLFLFNHTSHVDIPVLGAAIPRNFNFGAKIELFKIPVFARAMKEVGALPISRQQRAKVLELYKQSTQRVKQGESFALAPEGTRQKTAELGRFKNGPFIFSVVGQFPMVPVVLVGVHEILPKNRLVPNWGVWQRRKVLVKILPAVYTQGKTQEDLAALQSQVHGSMEEALKKGWSDVAEAY